MAGQGSTTTSGNSSDGVLLVLTDEALIYERRAVAADYADEAIKQLNSDLAAKGVRWRRAISYSDPNTLCECGRKHYPPCKPPRRDTRADFGCR